MVSKVEVPAWDEGARKKLWASRSAVKMNRSDMGGILGEIDDGFNLFIK